MQTPLMNYMQQLASMLEEGAAIEMNVVCDNAGGHSLPDPEEPIRSRDEEIIERWLQRQQLELCCTLSDDDDSEASFELEKRWEDLEEFVSGPPQQPHRTMSSSETSSSNSSSSSSIQSLSQSQLPWDTKCFNSPKCEHKCPPRMPLRQGSFCDRKPKHKHSMGPVAA
jgi:hypothetical protein